MDIRVNKLLSFLTVLVFTLMPAFSQNPWEIAKSKDGIEVYTRIEEDSEFKSFKAQIFIPASTLQIIEVLKEADEYANWYGYTKASKILKKDQDVQYNYVETIFPWPYHNRDMVYRMSIDTSDEQIITISLKGIADYIRKKKGIVRMRKAEGHIQLLPLQGGTEVTYVFHSEPGKNIPPWLANNSIAELPFRTLHGLRGIFESENPSLKQVSQD